MYLLSPKNIRVDVPAEAFICHRSIKVIVYAIIKLNDFILSNFTGRDTLYGRPPIPMNRGKNRNYEDS